MLIQTSFIIRSPGRGFIDLTAKINLIISKEKINLGLCNIFLSHTSASLTLCENYDPTVQADLEAFMQKLAPDHLSFYKHNTEGIDDMPSHIRSVLTQNSITIPISENKLNLGQWQGIYLWEHRLNSHQRKVMITLYA